MNFAENKNLSERVRTAFINEFGHNPNDVLLKCAIDGLFHFRTHPKHSQKTYLHDLHILIGYFKNYALNLSNEIQDKLINKLSNDFDYGTKFWQYFSTPPTLSKEDLNINSHYSSNGKLQDYIKKKGELLDPQTFFSAVLDKLPDDEWLDSRAYNEVFCHCFLDSTNELMYKTLEALSTIREREAIEDLKLIITEISSKLAILIAQNPNVLKDIEWRDLERIISEILSKMGFDVTLTPSSKDGGKDIIAKCIIRFKIHTYLIEIKHWKDKKVGSSHLFDFIRVVATEKSERGLFLSTSGYSSNSYEILTEVDKQKIALGTRQKILSLCQLYYRINNGMYMPKSELPEILFQGTL